MACVLLACLCVFSKCIYMCLFSGNFTTLRENMISIIIHFSLASYMRSLHLPLFGPMDDIITYFIITKKREKEAELLYTSQSHNATLGF